MYALEENYNSPKYTQICAGRYAGQFFQKYLKYYVFSFIGISKIFELFLKTHLPKLFKNYVYVYILFYIAVCAL